MRAVLFLIVFWSVVLPVLVATWRRDTPPPRNRSRLIRHHRGEA